MQHDVESPCLIKTSTQHLRRGYPRQVAALVTACNFNLRRGPRSAIPSRCVCPTTSNPHLAREPAEDLRDERGSWRLHWNAAAERTAGCSPTDDAIHQPCSRRRKPRRCVRRYWSRGRRLAVRDVEVASRLDRRPRKARRPCEKYDVPCATVVCCSSRSRSDWLFRPRRSCPLLPAT